jgi:hypothetical protein
MVKAFEELLRAMGHDDTSGKGGRCVRGFGGNWEERVVWLVPATYFIYRRAVQPNISPLSQPHCWSRWSGMSLSQRWPEICVACNICTVHILVALTKRAPFKCRTIRYSRLKDGLCVLVSIIIDSQEHCQEHYHPGSATHQEV